MSLDGALECITKSPYKRTKKKCKRLFAAENTEVLQTGSDQCNSNWHLLPHDAADALDQVFSPNFPVAVCVAACLVPPISDHLVTSSAGCNLTLCIRLQPQITQTIQCADAG